MNTNKVYRMGDNVDTDQIIGAVHLRLSTIQEMAPYLFEMEEGFDTDFQSGQIIVGQRNFGCGSSREQAPAVMKYRGVSAVVAKSFARIFYRNAINLGMPLVICPESDQIGHQDVITIDFAQGTLYNETTGKTHKCEQLPEFLQAMIAAGGAVKCDSRKG